MWLGGCAPRSVCTVPATAPASRIAPSHRTPTAARRWAPAGGQSHGSARATKASALDAWPPGKQRPGPPSATPQRQCDTTAAGPPKVCQSQGQLVALRFFTRFTATSAATASSATVSRSRRARPWRTPGHSAQTHSPTKAPVAALRQRSCSQRESRGSSRQAKPSGPPIICITLRSRPLASHSRVKASTASQARTTGWRQAVSGGAGRGWGGDVVMGRRLRRAD